MFTHLLKPRAFKPTAKIPLSINTGSQARFLATVEGNTPRQMPISRPRATPVSHDRATFTIRVRHGMSLVNTGDQILLIR